MSLRHDTCLNVLPQEREKSETLKEESHNLSSNKVVGHLPTFRRGRRCLGKDGVSCQRGEFQESIRHKA